MGVIATFNESYFSIGDMGLVNITGVLFTFSLVYRIDRFSPDFGKETR